MRILGIDPGSVSTGYGVIDHQNRKSRLVTCGSLQSAPGLPFEKRLLEIYDRLLELISDVTPDEAAVESAFYGANVKTLMKLCHARGVILLALANSNVPIFEYSPREVKKSVVGRGAASKEQVQFMVQNIFKIETLPDTYDATDAIGIALCHANRGGMFGVGEKKKNDLAAKLEAAKAKDQRSGKLEDKLKRLGVDATVRQALAHGKQKGRHAG
ncbi:MAG: crossover junction endodeoxyribonuclease RuvC [bacterium]|nr:crossover junction endodeoxyribonuclease RuvC [bacterium]